jgi:DNA-binding CsgD family transcriptional regulator
VRDATSGSGHKAQATATWEVSPYVVFGLLGFTLYLAWMFMLYASPAIAPEHLYTTVTGNSAIPASAFFRFALMVPLCLTLLAAWRLSDIFSGKTGMVVTIVLALALNLAAFLLIVFVPTHEPLLYLAWILTGISQGLIISLWSVFLATIGKNRILLLSAICVGSAALLYLFMTLLRPEAALWITFTLSWFSVLLFAFVHYRHDHTAAPLRVKAAVSDARFSISTKSALAVFIYCVGTGFTICLIIGQNPTMLGATIVGTATLIAGIIVTCDTLRFHRLSESLLVKLHLPALVIGIGPLFFNPFIGSTFAAGIFLIFLMVMFTINLSALSEHARIYLLSPIRVFGYGRLFNATGFTLGALAYYFAFEAVYPESMPQGSSLNIVLLVIIALFAIGTSFIFEDHYPVPEEQGVRPKVRDALHPLPHNDPKALLSLTSQEENEERARMGIWKRRCTQLAAQHHLSPKETEVLFLLAKGRNAEYIQNELVVSRHTAKAHIYHIYQKTDVHSRQELINLLEGIHIED